MSKSILVLEENSVIHGLVAAALDMDGLTLHHEFNPSRYVERARTLHPDLILVSNADQGNKYAILRQLKTQPGLGSVPVVLLANSRDRVDPEQLKALKVSGVVRKPFEASDLQLQVSKHLELVDLIGSSYEYRASQSVRDEGINPLTQIDVLDPEVTALMHDSGKAGQPIPEAAVPEVDFSAELRTDTAAQQTVTATTTARTEVRTARSTSEMRGGLEVLDDGPVERFSAGTPEPLAGEDVLLDEAELLPPLGTGALGSPPQPFQDGAIEELGPDDLLDDETYEETTFSARGVDRTLQRVPADGSESLAHLDEIEVELSADDVMFPEPEARVRTAAVASRPVAPPPPQPAAQVVPAAPAPAADAASELPPAVRRMMELRPVFSKAPDTDHLEPEPLAEPAGSISNLSELGLGDDELDEAAILKAMEQEDLAQLEPLDSSDPELLSLNSSDEFSLDSVEAEADLAPLSATPEQDDQDITIDEDEEELILSSLDEEEDQLPLASGLDLTREERQGLTEALEVEERKSVSTSTTTTTTSTMAKVSPTPVAANPFEALEIPQSSTLEDEIAAADLHEMDLLDDMGLDEPVAPLRSAPTVSTSEEEQFLSATFQNTQPTERPAGKFGLELPSSELLEVPVPESEVREFSKAEETLSTASWETQAAVRTQDAWPAEESVSEPDPGKSAGVDMSMFETTGTNSMMPEEESELSAAEAGVSESFEDAFAALKEEIESNPQGERLDDVLKMEQLQDAVAKIEFAIPQHENALARGMPLYAVPKSISGRVAVDVAKTHRATSRMSGEDSSVESMRRIVEETGTSRATTATVKTTVSTKTTTAIKTGMAAGAAELHMELSGSLLDEATKARLSQVLDEIISVSVRRAVREEMPRLMERIAKETGPSASA